MPKIFSMRPRSRGMALFRSAIRRRLGDRIGLRPYAGDDSLGRAAPCANGTREGLAAIGATGIDLARIVRQGALAIAPVVGVSRRHADLLDDGRIRIGSDMGFIALDSLV